jgi:mannose-6-phosphate isomerase-like protein (cupin superfamily)
VPPHQHDTSDEILFILAGKGRMTVNGINYPVGPNDAIRIPKGARHSLDVVEKLVAVQLYAPAGPEQRFKK